jgi:hypothetical protein
MDYTLLQSWLRLPAGSWPPDYYTLLDLPVEQAEAGPIEQRVMERMEVLRRHQIRHPELVTEGMNQLAQALVCLTDPDEKAAYDLKRGVLPKPKTVPPIVLRKPEAPVLPKPTAFDATDFAIPATVFDLDEESDTTDSQDVPDATMVIEIPFTAGLEPPLSLEDEPPRIRAKVEEPTPEPATTAEPIVEAKTAAGPVSNRWIYRRLAVVRRCLRSWDAIAPVIATPDEWLDRPPAVFTFLHAATEMRPLGSDFRSVLEASGQNGLATLAVVTHPTPCELIRSLLPEQRAKLAVDWSRGRTVLEHELGRLRSLHRRPQSVRVKVLLHRGANRLLAQPSLVLVLLALAALFLAAIRSSVTK